MWQLYSRAVKINPAETLSNATKKKIKANANISNFVSMKMMSYVHQLVQAHLARNNSLYSL